MFKRLILLPLLVIGFTQGAVAGTYSPDNNDLKMRKKVVILVNNAAKLVKKDGRISAVCTFNKQNRQAKTGEPYLFAFVCNDGKNDSIVLANKNIDFVFTSFYKHPNHIIFRRELEKHPKGVWVSYRAKNADTGKIEAKRSFLVKLSKYKICIGSGYFPKP